MSLSKLTSKSNSMVLAKMEMTFYVNKVTHPIQSSKEKRHFLPLACICMHMGNGVRKHGDNWDGQEGKKTARREGYVKEDTQCKQCESNVNGDGDFVLLNIDGSSMGHEIYMKHKVDICISCVKRHV